MVLKIIKQDAYQLVLRQRNLLALFVGLLFFVVGIVTFFLSSFELWLSILITLLGIITLVLWHYSTIIIDKSTNTITIKARTIFKIVKNDTHKFSDVKKIRFVTKEYLSKGIKLGFHIYGDLKKDEVIDFKPFGVNITAKHIPSSRQAQEKQREIAKTIADFLKVPFKEGYLSRKDIRSAKKL
jgi:K+ transporter